jgi:gamma-glutamyltranspeptidase
LVQKDLAETLKLIQKLGAKGFYEGKTAELLVAEMKEVMVSSHWKILKTIKLQKERL